MVSVFLAARRGGRSFEDEYLSGNISNHSKRIYDAIRENGSLPYHTVKRDAGFSKEDSAKFERALVDLQMKMYITICGQQRKVSEKGEEYGWSSMVYCTTEESFGGEVFERAARIDEREAIEKITSQIYELNPEAEPEKIIKLIKG